MFVYTRWGNKYQLNVISRLKMPRIVLQNKKLAHEY